MKRMVVHLIYKVFIDLKKNMPIYQEICGQTHHIEDRKAYTLYNILGIYHLATTAIRCIVLRFLDRNILIRAYLKTEEL